MKKQTNIITIITIVSVCCVIMAFVDGIIRPGYLVKSAIKLILFAACPIIYSLFNKQFSIKRLFTPNKKGLSVAVILGFAVYAVIIGAYFALRNVFDLSGITKSLVSNVGVSQNNFVWVAVYISFANSLLEEFFT